VVVAVVVEVRRRDVEGERDVLARLQPGPADRLDRVGQGRVDVRERRGQPALVARSGRALYFSFVRSTAA
jgi:hypothetical protein